MASILEKYSNRFRARLDVENDDAEIFLDALIEESDEVTLASLFESWNQKGIEEDEIYSIARIMRERCVKVRSNHDRIVDIVGTGGAKAKTFNVSTCSAFVVAGAGAIVAKHGNKAATSRSGSADVLTEIGINSAADAKTAERCLSEIGICFMFAPNFHRLSPTLAKVRRDLGFPTIFNCVGPLSNPAGAQHQLIGAWDKEMVPKIANALARLGTNKSWIVHGEDGLDEISLEKETLVAEVEKTNVKYFRVSQADFELKPVSSMSDHPNTATESADTIIRILENQDRNGAAESIVRMNSMAAFYIAGHSKTLTSAGEYVIESIRNEQAMRKLRSLAAATRK